MPAASRTDRIDLSHHTGSVQLHVTTLRGRAFLVTDGVLDLCERAGAFWLADAVASHQTRKVHTACEGFQVWRLRKLPEGSANAAALECWTDTPGTSARVVSQYIPFTDFPWDRIGADEFIWYVQGYCFENNPSVMMLRSEH